MILINPSIKLITVLIIALEISFTQSIITNILIILIGLLYLLINNKITWNTLLILLLAIIPAVGIFMSQNMYGNAAMGNILVTRLYAYITLGLTFTKTTTLQELGLSLEQNLKMPTKFVYGFMGGFNLINYVKQDIADIKQAAHFRNINLHFWSPSLYFKAILSAIRYAELLSEGMESHGFSEKAYRTHYKKIALNKSDYFKATFILLILQISIVFI
ncbi:energy-coupling factor transporter transmembrane protein EcfT [Apilactobacillus sp. TMW 2.2459]|uniref:energy-coupling factor transporter transmembrane component T n=1 Tax=Apilactobacillus xinyiensis TaxID=2841032 RepID=UPI00200CE6B5|nr:energy-coupling factor transporter transmembrane protein EcfT [Apilactobacillus xinyiensis]